MEQLNYQRYLCGERPRPTAISGRGVVEETESNRGRVMQSAALRRLQQKTQVYPLERNAAVRSRLTHSLEVMQTGRFITRRILQLLEENKGLEYFGLTGLETAFTNLVEMACLLHDVGNPPFGHFGEAAINEWFTRHGMACYHRACGSDPSSLFSSILWPDLACFEGNAQAIRILHSLQQLNLTYSQLAAVIKYPRGAWQPKPVAESPCAYRHKKPGYFFSERILIEKLQSTLQIQPGCRHPLVYIMEAADDIAYCIADLEDAVDKGVLSLAELQQFLKEEWISKAGQHDWLINIINRAAIDAGESAHEFITELRTVMVNQLVDYAAQRYSDLHSEVFTGTLDEPLIDGGSVQHLALESLRAVAAKHIFHSFEVETPELRGYTALTGLLDLFRPLLEIDGNTFTAMCRGEDINVLMPPRLYHRLAQRYKQACQLATERELKALSGFSEQRDMEWYYRARLVLDYLTGMTDNFVVAEYQTLRAI